MSDLRYPLFLTNTDLATLIRSTARRFAASFDMANFELQDGKPWFELLSCSKSFLMLLRQDGTSSSLAAPEKGMAMCHHFASWLMLNNVHASSGHRPSSLVPIQYSLQMHMKYWQFGTTLYRDFLDCFTARVTDPSQARADTRKAWW